MTQQSMQSEPNEKKLYAVNFRAHYTHSRNYPRIYAESEEDAVVQAEKMFWKETQGWGIDSLELGSVRLQNES